MDYPTSLENLCNQFESAMCFVSIERFDEIVRAVRKMCERARMRYSGASRGSFKDTHGVGERMSEINPLFNGGWEKQDGCSPALEGQLVP